ncbi:uncharacterized protein MYCFIDRAFT_214557 [Pseudocercospora fijiensis CIRAD86]|uniref:Major facilitator superfamily (MFS) profile domain-containing protein n=1 Tax=Pseudocercospora fijiensis (strain CIRAD86) TaxID=383855 RepID=M2ZYD2_PSEFD|nr:uncharacterized protein MYCFIDRAFT_214557 [Pseudocercospora fijiensis CIRAD86]EME83959.1 hypothetical protein MYCFIDRAFT_214557 [Pseudocercospora fijiensis CIRAD86]
MEERQKEGTPQIRPTSSSPSPPLSSPKKGPTVNDSTTCLEDISPQKSLLGAQAANDDEHALTFREATALFPKAILFSIGISLAIIMEGYDNSLLGNIFSLPQFREYFGKRLPNGDYQVSASWQSATNAIGSVGGIIGLILAGWMVEKVGYRRSMHVALAFITAAIFITFFAHHIITLFFGQLITGIPFGMFQGMASAYAADIAPLALRAVLTSFLNLCWCIGQFIATGAMKAALTRHDEWGFRIPFATQWFWPVPIAIIVFLAPESPWWLMRKGRRDDTKAALRRLTATTMPEEQLENYLQLIDYTNEHEKNVQEGTTFYDLFKGSNLRRTEIAAMAWACQVASGIWLSGNITYFLEQAGFDPQHAFSFGLGMTGLTCVGTIASWFVGARVGRRALYLTGLTGMLAIELIVGAMGIPRLSSGIGYASGVMLVLHSFIYSLTIGPVCFTIVPEVPSARLRQRTVVVARSAYQVLAIGANFLSPPMLNPTAWNLRGRAGFVWASICLIALTWTFFRLPECKDRTPFELDLLFERRTPTRAFKHAKVNAFRFAEHEITERATQDE